MYFGNGRRTEQETLGVSVKPDISEIQAIFQAWLEVEEGCRKGRVSPTQELRVKRGQKSRAFSIA